ncbi:MAG: DUF4282 domain-containing protein [Alphaproteobacteria bacterium]|nr:DUF4282 domain-containing protein [Alphaproteobacteria bacterium]
MKFAKDFKSMVVDLLLFKRLITGSLVRILYWLAVLILTWGFIYHLWLNWAEADLAFKLYWALALVVMLFIARIVSEMFMILLGTYSRLGEIREQLSRSGYAKAMPMPAAAAAARPKPAKAAAKAKPKAKAAVKPKAKTKARKK